MNKKGNGIANGYNSRNEAKFVKNGNSNRNHKGIPLIVTIEHHYMYIMGKVTYNTL